MPEEPSPNVSSPSRSGVFGDSTDRRLERFAESISFDRRLYRQDIRGSIAHARMLSEVGILTAEEFEQIESNLREIQTEIDQGQLEMRIELEDIHMHIEQALIDRIGDVGRKLHSARSRNDQVSTDARLWTREAIDRVDELLHQLQAAFVGRCDRDMDVILPAYTHLQRAQPVLAPHYWLAYAEKFDRDRTRLRDARRRLNHCPLGVAAVAGTTMPIDRQRTAALLDFDDVTANSLDTSSDRDFIVETLFGLSMIASHLSGWAEEWILWSTVEYDFIQIPQAFCTGSSIMPQKVNPDTLELIRGKSARVMASLTQSILLIKNLPLAYNRDLQEDKPALFDAFDTVEAMLELAEPIVAEATLNRSSIASRLEHGYLDATTLMEWMMQKGMPQRRAHHLVGAIVRDAMQRKVPLSEMDLSVFQSHAPEIDESVFECLGCRNAVAAFVSYGSTAPSQVEKQVKRWKEKVQTQ